MYTLLTVVYCVALWTLVTGDYDCICNYNVEEPINSSPADGQPIGYMYEFDCKPLISIGKPPGWGLVAFEHKTGYLALDANIEVQMCPGSPPDGDVIYRDTTKPTTKIAITSPPTTKTKAVTTSQSISLKPEPSKTMQTGVWENMTPSVTNQSAAVTIQTEHPVNQSSIPTHSTPQTPITTSFSLISKPPAYRDNITVPEYNSTQVLSTLGEVTTQNLYYSSVNTSFAEATTAVSATKREITTPNLLNTSVSESLTDTSRFTITSTKPPDIITSPIISTTTDRIDLCPYKFLSEVHENIHNKVFGQYMRYCYELRLKTGTWLDASKDCSERRGMLVVITDPHVQSLVHGLVNDLQPPADIWLGLSDRDEEGQPTSYTNWTLVDPVYNDIKDCAIMSHDSGSWMQAECSFYMLHTERLPWVCQYGI
ncbi:PGCA-like protein [Mya arenaria]|uniref:PGCA-like protein n=1 Tax=Mya arenaria TaxID=6604 RepID=A0ABY7G710_MYAAR|nr:PGCA-like protein [Mya arenaria]